MKRSFIGTTQALLIAAALLIPGLRAADAPLVGDSYISSAQAGTNFGAATTLNVTAGTSSGLVRFDLSGYAPGTAIGTAYLKVFVDRVTTPGTLTFTQVTSDWTEGTVNFASQPTVAGSPFGSASASTANNFVVVDATALVQNWISNPASNFGIEISGSGTVLLDSKENTATSHPAVLEISVIGPAGPTGPPGPQGGPGPAGASGPNGPSGPQGVSGPTGPTGPTGPSGPLGNVGAQGTAGPTGPTGPSGAAGPSGSVGPNGPQGASGPLGANGPQGPTGPAGPTGTTGLMGANGSTGPTGPVGATGTPGAQGPSGAAGNTGPQGNQGSAGPQGASGPVGPTGIQGPLGPTGATGVQGSNGPTGNVFNMDNIAHTSGFTISDNDAHIYFIVDNTGGLANMNLPHANVAGKTIVVFAKVNVGAADPSVQVTAQGGDTIRLDSTSVGSMTINRVAALRSDGAGNWYFYTGN